MYTESETLAENALLDAFLSYQSDPTRFINYVKESGFELNEVYRGLDTDNDYIVIYSVGDDDDLFAVINERYITLFVEFES